MAPSNVKMTLYVKRYLNVNKISTLNVKIENKVCTYSVDFNTFRVKMFYTFREPNLLTFRVIFSHIASIFTFSVHIFSHLATFSHIEALHVRPRLTKRLGLVGVTLSHTRNDTICMSSSVYP